MKKNTLLFSILLATISFSSQAQNTWIQKADFGGTARRGAIGFSIGNKGYIGTGYDNVQIKKDFWAYDPVTNVWTQIADLEGPERRFAVAFVIAAYGYVGTGQNDFGTLKDFWRYDPINNSWEQRADLAGTARYWAVGFSVGSKGYIGTGTNDNNLKKDFWEYDPLSDTWAKKNDFGGKACQQAVGFSIGSRGYIGTGNANFKLTNQFLQYNPTNDSWAKKADFPGNGLLLSTSFSIGGKGYIGLGSDTADILTNQFWEYDTLINSWSEKASFPGTSRKEAVGFAIDGRGYIGTGYDGNFTKDFWQYNPESGCTSPTGLTTTGITNSNATLQWNAVDGAVKYKLRYKVTGSNPGTTIYPTGTSKTISGLSAGTSYTWQVKTICSTMPNAASEWSPKQIFTTALRLGTGEEIGQTEVYPNPFTSSATISFSLEEKAHTTISIFDLTGHHIKTLLDANMDAGAHEIQLNRDQLSAGIYLVTETINDALFTMKIIIE